MSSEFKYNVYRVTLADLDGLVQNFPFSKIFQIKWGLDIATVTSTYRPVRNLLREYRAGNLDADTCIRQIHEAVCTAKLEWPNRFNKKGWYDKKVWREAEGNEKELEKYQDKLAKLTEKLDKEKEAKDRYAQEQKDLKESMLARIKGAGLTMFTIRDVKPIAKELGLRTFDKWDMIRLLQGSIKEVKRKFYLTE